ncbi:hypothetical protein CXG81DRAFT_27653 [Caulochytrium protostelioides]|uniref:ATP-grasp domain-containing protein n=1 Tax=Caulochytrium protostelioides TaxID=1555241 RepID=A0A4P9X3J7_9FUNG|nr:hypothetical protein CXG81DRAFT_27653 [Caulochytrium protostelioides]|eukprot:RKO99605.1 hypothetical protein CXG81DRAFT_27653 [Caulochytrium protostelioides]
MRVLVLGAGGRESALVASLLRDERVTQIAVAPGNGGTATIDPRRVQNIALAQDGPDFAAVCAYVREHRIDLVVPGPEQPLVDGVADAVKAATAAAVFGPSAAAARIEGSKAFSKHFMQAEKIPTAAFATFTEVHRAVAYLQNELPAAARVVIKVSGLAAGKGVLLPATRDEAIADVRRIMVDRVFGDAGTEVVIEEFLEGHEVSCLAFTDGYTILPLPYAQDHKRAYDNDAGPNTGGMGVFAPTPRVSDADRAFINREILQRCVDGLRRRRSPFVGILYAGVILTPQGPKTLEYNCRFGDPETEALLPLLTSSLADLMFACCHGYLDAVTPTFLADTIAVSVIIAAEGYPGAYAKGQAITIPAALPDGVTVYHAGTTLDGAQLTSSGGRVLAVTGLGATYDAAFAATMAGVRAIDFPHSFYRTDIGAKAFAEHRSKADAAGSNGGKLTYADAGVSIAAGDALVHDIKAIVRRTRRVGADAEIGGFGGCFDLAACGFKDPVLVAGIDGVGTKVLIAKALGDVSTVGIDLVAMNANDVLAQGAEPLFFLDYLATGHLDVGMAAAAVGGVAEGCLQARCALVGGETAEMPAVYARGDFDMAGCVVGAVERSRMLPRTQAMTTGDVLIGLPSSGVHSNGFSLVRKIVERAGLPYTDPCPWQPGTSLGAALLTPTRIYVTSVLPLVAADRVKGLAHITGGGLIENIPRALPKGAVAHVDTLRWELPPTFRWLQQQGGLDPLEVARTFNCGIGMVLVVAADDVADTLALLAEHGEPNAVRIGHLEVTNDPALPAARVDMAHLDAWAS